MRTIPYLPSQLAVRSTAVLSCGCWVLLLLSCGSGSSVCTVSALFGSAAANPRRRPRGYRSSCGGETSELSGWPGRTRIIAQRVSQCHSPGSRLGSDAPPCWRMDRQYDYEAAASQQLRSEYGSDDTRNRHKSLKFRYDQLANGGTARGCSRACRRFMESPLAWAGAAVTVLCTVVVISSAMWGFMFGVVSAVLCAVATVAVSAGLAAALPYNTTRKVPFFLSRILGLCFLAAIAFWMHKLARIRWATPDPVWTALPQCRNNTQLLPGTSTVWPVNNCAVLSPYRQLETAGLLPLQFSGTASSIQAYFEDIVDNGVPTSGGGRTSLQSLMACTKIQSIQSANKMSAFSHWRCLSPALGYPDDLALEVTCGESGVATVSMFSQSRQGAYDWAHNEFRVRLLASVPTQPWVDASKLPTGTGCDA